MDIRGTEMGKVYVIRAYLIIHRGPQRPAWHPLCALGIPSVPWGPLCALGRVITPGGAKVQETTAGTSPMGCLCAWTQTRACVCLSICLCDCISLGCLSWPHLSLMDLRPF